MGNKINTVTNNIEQLINCLPKQLTVRQASVVFNIPEWTLRKYISDRIVPHRRIGRKIYIVTERMEAWLESFDVKTQKEKDDHDGKP